MFDFWKRWTWNGYERTHENNWLQRKRQRHHGGIECIKLISNEHKSE
jgi:hypothetical protein